jgi:hypothetical protein
VAVTVEPGPAPQAAARPARDVVLGLFQTSWRGALQRGLCMPDDRLAAALPSHPRVNRMLLVNPPRRIAARARDLLHGRGPAADWPAGDRASLYEPLRLDPSEPGTEAGARRWALRVERGMERHARRAGLVRPAVISTHPVVAGFGRFDWADSVTYYAWDDWLVSKPHREWWPAYEAAFGALRERERKVIAVSSAARDRVAPTGPSLVVPNGLEGAEWREPSPCPTWFTELPGPRMLYVGSLDDRVDVSQIERLAQAFPEGSIVLAGPLQVPDHYATLRELPGVHLPGSVGRADLTGLVRAADVCLVPHVRNSMTEAMSPLKLYEYLAAGRPVAAVALPGTAHVDARVQLVEPGADLTPAVKSALALGPMSETERLRFIDVHAWERRFDRILSFMLDER